MKTLHQHSLSSVLTLITIFIGFVPLSKAQDATDRTKTFKWDVVVHLSGGPSFDPDLFFDGSYNLEVGVYQGVKWAHFAKLSFTSYTDEREGGSENPLRGFGFTIADVGLFGNGAHHFEYNLGTYVLVNRSDILNEPHTLNGIGPHLFAGYRYQKPQGSFMFRAGVGWPEVVGVGVGYSVNRINVEKDRFDHPNMNIHFNFPFPYLAVEKYITQSPRISFYGRTSLGYRYYTWEDAGIGLGFSMVALTGRRAHHAEAGAGIAGVVGVWQNTQDRSLEFDGQMGITPLMFMGYRLQDFEKGKMLFRVGVGWPEIAYIGFGRRI